MDFPILQYLPTKGDEKLLTHKMTTDEKQLFKEMDSAVASADNDEDISADFEIIIPIGNKYGLDKNQSISFWIRTTFSIFEEPKYSPNVEQENDTFPEINNLIFLTLPKFDSIEEARRLYYKCRDSMLRRFLELSSESPNFNPDFKPESLKSLEKWYFNLIEEDKFSGLGVTIEEFEFMIAVYTMKIAVKNDRFRWSVCEHHFVKGAYEFGVTRDLGTFLWGWFSNIKYRPNNKRRQSQWRLYQKYLRR